MASALVAYYVHVHARFTSRRIRWSLRANLFVVIVLVQLMLVGVGVREWYNGSISFRSFLYYQAISSLGQVAPELCVLLGEFFTSVDYTPVRSLAANSDLGVVQVVLQGLGQGFFSTFFPAAIMIVIVVVTWEIEGHYGLALLSAASVSSTGFQGGIA